MSSLKNDILIEPQALYSSVGTTQIQGPYYNYTPQVGQRAVTGDGREFRFALAGGTALVPGKLQQCAAETTSFENLTPTATAIGATSITAGSSVTTTANQLAGGWAIITVTPGQGYQYQISSNAASTAAAVTVALADPVIVALTTSSRVDLVPNPYNSVIVNPATATGNPVGVAIFAVAASQYGWIQTKGVAAVLADGAVTVGTNLVASNAVAGAVEPLTGVQALVGIAVTGIADTEYGAVDLLLA